MNEVLQKGSMKLGTKLPDLIIADGVIEALKWLALLAMTLDHINHALYKWQLPIMSEFGRIAMPLFGFVLAYNLARPHAQQSKAHFRVIKRMAIFGLLATPFYIAALEKTNWIPLNILFTLLLATAIIYHLEKGGFYRELLSTALFINGGIFVEYIWFGLGYCLSAWYYCKKPNVWRLVLWASSTACLYFANDNFWAMATLPIIYLATKIEFTMPRIRLAFYIYYPLHLSILLAIKTCGGLI